MERIRSKRALKSFIRYAFLVSFVMSSFVISAGLSSLFQTQSFESGIVAPSRDVRVERVSTVNKTIDWYGYHIVAGEVEYASDLGPVDWNTYRISDGIAQYAGDVCQTHPGTLVCQYLKLTDKLNDMDVLLPLLESLQNNIDVPDKATAILHLRTGDGLCHRYDPPCRGNRTDVPDCWLRDEDCWADVSISPPRQYAFSVDWYTGLIDKLDGIEHIEIVADPLHWTRTADPRGGNFTVDENYVKSAATFFQSLGFALSFREQRYPDVDFAYMCAASYFIQGGGGFSMLVSSVVRARGGHVFTPSNQRRRSPT